MGVNEKVSIEFSVFTDRCVSATSRVAVHCAPLTRCDHLSRQSTGERRRTRLLSAGEDLSGLTTSINARSSCGRRRRLVAYRTVDAVKRVIWV